MLIHQTDHLIIEAVESTTKHSYYAHRLNRLDTPISIDCDSIDLVVTVQLNGKLKKTKFNVPYLNGRENFIVFGKETDGYIPDYNMIYVMLNILNDFNYLDENDSGVTRGIINKVVSYIKEHPCPEYYNLDEVLERYRAEIYKPDSSTTNCLENDSSFTYAN